MTSLAEGIREIDSKLAAGLVDDYRHASYHNVLSMEERRRKAADAGHDAADLMRLGRVLTDQSLLLAERTPVS